MCTQLIYRGLKGRKQFHLARLFFSRFFLHGTLSSLWSFSFILPIPLWAPSSLVGKDRLAEAHLNFFHAPESHLGNGSYRIPRETQHSWRKSVKAAFRSISFSTRAQLWSWTKRAYQVLGWKNGPTHSQNLPGKLLFENLRDESHAGVTKHTHETQCLGNIWTPTPRTDKLPQKKHRSPDLRQLKCWHAETQLNPCSRNSPNERKSCEPTWSIWAGWEKIVVSFSHL